MKSTLLQLLSLFFALSALAQTETTDFLQEPSESASNIDSIWAKAARKKAKTVSYTKEESGHSFLQSVAHFNNKGKLIYINNPSEEKFTRSHYSYYVDGYKILRVKGDNMEIAKGGTVEVTEEMYDINGNLISYGKGVTAFDSDTMTPSGYGYTIKMNGKLPAEKYDSKTNETEYYTYDSHGFIAEIKRTNSYDCEKYRRVYVDDKLFEVYYSKGGMIETLFERFEYNNQGLVSKRITGIAPTYKGMLYTYEYNAAKQLIKDTRSHAENIADFLAYNIYTYDSAGRITKQEDKLYKLDYYYNAEGLLISAEDLAVPDDIYRESYTYTYWE